MCRMIVPEMRGEKDSGALWQREQFAANTSFPSRGLLAEPSCDCAACCTEDLVEIPMFVAWDKAGKEINNTIAEKKYL